MPLISTTGDLIEFALRASGILGIGQTASAEDANTGLEFLRNLIAQWQRKRWLTIVDQEVSVAASTGASSYTIGPGGDFNCARPDHIAAAYIRILGTTPNLVDIPIEVILAREDYARVSVKSLITMPAVVWYESAWPIGNLHWWPIPPANQYGLFVVIKGPLPLYSTLTDALNLPQEYYEALLWSLCVRLQMAYGLPARPDHAQAMNQAMNTLRQANAQIAEAPIPAALLPTFKGLSMVGPGLGRAFILDQGAVL